MAYEFPEDETRISARVIEDSLSIHGHRLTTMVVTLHRFMLAEFNTHRMFSRSSASSRAIPVEKMLAKATNHPAWPAEWLAEQAGMAASKPLEGQDHEDARLLFSDIKTQTLSLIMDYLADHPDKSTRLHKGLLNRLMEPFQWHTLIVTSTDWNNYFRQRASPLAQREIREAAEMMLAEYDASSPRYCADGDWHLPFVSADERANTPIDKLKAMSTARCARVSLLNHDGTYSEEADLKLYERLCNPGDGPPHAAPLEHVATPDKNNAVEVVWNRENGRGARAVLPALGNFLGYSQLRHRVLGF